jgi:hypothetical protein
VGWRQFFTPIEKQGLLVIAESETELRYKLMAAHEAHATLPPEAFGPPWWKALARDVLTAFPR